MKSIEEIDQMFLDDGNENKFVCPLQRTDERYPIYKQLVYQDGPVLQQSFPSLSKSAIRKQIFQMFCDLPDFLYEPIWNDYTSNYQHTNTDDASCYSSESESEFYIEENDKSIQ